jgi:hypothetical protein
MPGRHHTLLKSVAVVLWIVHHPDAQVLACSCMESPLSTQQALERYDAVFLGQILEMRLRSTDHPAQPDGSEPVDGIEVVAKVLETWKGTDQDRIQLFTNPDGGSCGYPFEIGQRYLIWATRSHDELTVSSCGRTKRVGTPGVDTDHLNLVQTADTWKWRRVTAPGFTLLLPKEFSPDATGTKLEELDGQLLSWGAPLRPPKAGGWSFAAQKISYEYVRRESHIDRPPCESQVAGHQATIRNVAMHDGQTLISVHWPDVTPGSLGLILRCVSGPSPATNTGNVCLRVFDSVQFGGEPHSSDPHGASQLTWP